MEAQANPKSSDRKARLTSNALARGHGVFRPCFLSSLSAGIVLQRRRPLTLADCRRHIDADGFGLISVQMAGRQGPGDPATQ